MRTSSNIAQAVLVAGSIQGIESQEVSVQVQIAQGLPSFKIVGLADVAVQEARERVISALKACGITLPAARITVNLAPAPLKKRGSSFDLSIAVAILIACGKIPASYVKDCLFVGELSLDGSVNGVLGSYAFAKQAKEANMILVGSQVCEAAALMKVKAYEISHLRELFEYESFKDEAHIPTLARREERLSAAIDFSEIVGQESAKRALLIAAAGVHNILLIGPPGTGKTMLASALLGIMPDLDSKQMCETALVHSVSNKGGLESLTHIPFRSPHHSSSAVGLIGGGNPAQPGEVSLAHNGVLFLDEIAQFNPSALQALRTPLQDGEVHIVRGDYSYRFPSRFALVAASNPCPCGYFGDREKECHCTNADIKRYQARIGGPLLDRFDLIVWVYRTRVEELLDQEAALDHPPQNNDEIRTLVSKAYAFRIARGGTLSSAMTKDELVAELADEQAKIKLTRAANRLKLSNRAVIKVLRVARTIADLNESEKINSDDILEALSYRAGWDS